ncbi:MAG TPA: lysine--tRNA ligase [Candidatus Bipolaricaulota bacterium]|nr:lysine--tRNA ligase [Candidatus Bipolaricaulota bacterium]
MDQKITKEQEARLQNLEKIRAAGIEPYPEKFEKKQTLAQAKKLFEGKKVSVAGRIMLLRDMGKLTFCHLLDASGKMQIVLKQDEVGKEAYKVFVKNFDIGDFLGVNGEIFTTQKGEISVLVKKYEFLGKALRPLPEKWHGLKDVETRYRQRYLDLIMNDEARQIFNLRSRLIKSLREFYWEQGFQEVETPVLLHEATGAHAKPYKTHHNALDMDVYLRISHELPLKELIVGGYEKIFELGKAFRNEGIDPSHLPEHTHLEHYAAYWNFEDNIAFTEKMFDYLFDKLGLDRKIDVPDRDGKMKKVDFSTPFKRVNFIDLLKKDTGLDVLDYTDVKELLKDIKKKGIKIEGMEKMNLYTLIDNLYKKVSRPKLIQPTFLYYYPESLQPLARRNNKDPRVVDQFQLVINTWELAKAYSELVDPIDQRQRFEQQMKDRAAGDEEASEIDEDFITAMEYGMPPISGWGIGIDRLMTILTGQENLRDVVFFPLMKTKE